MEHFDDEFSKKFAGLESSLPSGGWGKMQRMLWWARWRTTVISSLSLSLVLAGYLYWTIRSTQVEYGKAIRLESDIAISSLPLQSSEIPLPSHPFSAKPKTASSRFAITETQNPHQSHLRTQQDDAPSSANSTNHLKNSPHVAGFIAAKEHQHGSQSSGADPKDIVANDGGNLAEETPTVAPPNTPSVSDPVAANGFPSSLTPLYAARSAANPRRENTPVPTLAASHSIATIRPSEMSLGSSAERDLHPLFLPTGISSIRFLEITVSSRVACKQITPHDQNMLWRLENGGEYYSQRWSHEIGLSIGQQGKSQGDRPSRTSWSAGISLLNINEAVSYSMFEEHPSVVATSMHGIERMSAAPAQPAIHQMSAQLYYINLQLGGEYAIGRKTDKFVAAGAGVGKLLGQLSEIAPQEHFQAAQVNPYGYLSVGKIFKAPDLFGRGYQVKLSASTHYYPHSFTGAFDVSTATFGLDLTLRKLR